MALLPPPVPIIRSSSNMQNISGSQEESIIKPYQMKTATNQNGEHLGIKPNNSNNSEKKCQVYVHQSRLPKHSSSYMPNDNWQSGNEIHQIAYEHEKSDSYNNKVEIFRKQFDSLAINERSIHYQSPHGFLTLLQNSTFSLLKNSIAINPQSYVQATKIPVVKSNQSAKLNQFLMQKPDQQKATLDRLEEQYWAKWKPIKNTTEVKPNVKVKTTTSPKYIPEKLYHVPVRKLAIKEESEKSVEVKTPKVAKEQPTNTQANKAVSNCTEKAKEVEDVHIVSLPSPEVKEPLVLQTDLPQASSIETVVSNKETPKEAESESSMNNLKHTDSLILTSKKQMQELGKPHFQQPKCIKLFKNVGCTPVTMTTFIKGGSYPLKSCLKRDGGGSKQARLGRPGSPMTPGNSRKSGRRYSKS